MSVPSPPGAWCGFSASTARISSSRLAPTLWPEWCAAASPSLACRIRLVPFQRRLPAREAFRSSLCVVGRFLGPLLCPATALLPDLKYSVKSLSYPMFTKQNLARFNLKSCYIIATTKLENINNVHYILVHAISRQNTLSKAYVTCYMRALQAFELGVREIRGFEYWKANKHTVSSR